MYARGAEAFRRTNLLAPQTGLEPVIPFGILINSQTFYLLNYCGI